MQESRLNHKNGNRHQTVSTREELRRMVQPTVQLCQDPWFVLSRNGSGTLLLTQWGQSSDCWGRRNWGKLNAHSEEINVHDDNSTSKDGDTAAKAKFVPAKRGKKRLKKDPVVEAIETMKNFLKRKMKEPDTTPTLLQWLSTSGGSSSRLWSKYQIFISARIFDKK